MNQNNEPNERSQAENPGGYVPLPHGGVLQGVLSAESGQQGCVCVWPLSFGSVRQTRKAMDRVLGPLAGRVIRVDAVQHKYFPLRLDLFVTKDIQDAVAARLLKAKGRLGLRHVKVHVGYWERIRARGLPGDWWADRTTTTDGFLSLATLNLHGGLRRKKDELAAWSGARQVNALLLQETNRAEWGGQGHAAVPGFEGNDVPVFSGMVGARGIGVWTKRGCVSRPLMVSALERDTAYKGLSFRRVRLPGANKWMILGSLYLAQGAQSRAIRLEVKKVVTRMLQKHPEDVMVLGGDFNMPGDRLDAMLRQWGVPMARVRLDGSPLTYHSTRAMSSLDHFVMTTRDMHLVVSASVDRTWDNSDHWPVVLRLKVLVGNEVVSMAGVNAPTAVAAAQDQDEWTSAKVAKIRLRRDELSTKQGLVINSNRFAALAALMEDSVGGHAADAFHNDNINDHNNDNDHNIVAVEAIAEHFLRVNTEVAVEAGLVVVSPSGKTQRGSKLHYGLDAEARRLISRRHDLAKLLTREARRCLSAESEPEGVQDETMTKVSIVSTARLVELNRRYKVASKAVNKRLEQSKQVAWNRYVAGGAALMAQNDAKRAWRWAKNHLVDPDGGRVRSMLPRVISPVYRVTDSGADGVNHTTRKLCLEPGEIVSQWTSYYTDMLRDATGHSSAGNGYWDTVAAEMALASQSTLEGMNGDVTWREVNEVLRSFRGSKAAGLSGFSPDWFKLAQEDPRTVIHTGQPKSALGKVLLCLCQQMFNSAHIPRTLRAAEVVNILKAGDSCDMNNYRGISLIELPVKVISAVITRRVSDQLEKAGRLTGYQAGFRREEEAMGHVVGLHELVQRRLNKGKTTYLAFIDVKKAFDSVPHGALLKKLDAIGVRGRCHAFFAALYESTVVRIRCGGGYMTNDIPVERGVRQGCPASPLLFNIFINDMLGECSAFGVVLILGKQTAAAATAGGAEAGAHSKQKVPGLLFADDLVLTSPSKKQLARALQAITRWANAWELTFNAVKCGVMGVGVQGKSVSEVEWMLQGGVIPVVQKYKYLGMWFTEKWSYDEMLVHHEGRVQAALHSSLSFLSNSSIPTALRLLVLKGQLLPIANYGGELFGMCGIRAVRTQSLVNRALKAVIGAGARTYMGSAVTLMLEFGVVSVHASWSGQRARLLLKLGGSRTVARHIVAARATMACRKGTWSSIARRWLKVFGPKLSDFDPSTCVDEYGLPIVAPKLMGQKVRIFLMRKLLTQSGGVVSLRVYRENEYIQTGMLVIKQGLKFPGLAKGVSLLIRLRTGWGRTALRSAQMNAGPAEWRDTCPFCHRQGQPEDTEHLLVSCTRWKQQRKATSLRRASKAMASYWCARNPDIACSNETLVALLLGGKSSIVGKDRWLKDGVYDASLDESDGLPAAEGILVGPTQGPGSSEVVGESVGESEGGPKLLPYFAVVAGFLMSVEGTRIRVLHAHHPSNEPTPPGAGQSLVPVGTP